jgi:hypothetical protein
MNTRPEETQQLGDIISTSFSEVYSSHSYDVAQGTFNFDSIEGIEGYVDCYRHTPLIQFTSFAGIPNQFDANEKITGMRIFTNMFDWQRNKTANRNIINAILALPMFIKNLVMIALALAQNSVKLFTEFLPVLFSNGLRILANRTYALSKEGIHNIYSGDHRLHTKIFKITGYALLICTTLPIMLLSISFKFAQLTGRTITSPIDSVRAAWFFCINMDQSEGKFAGKLLGCILATISILMTATIYSLLIPYLVTLAPASLATVMTNVANAFSGLNPLFAYFGSNLMIPHLIRLNLLTILTSHGIFLSPIMAGFTTLFGTLLTTLGPLIQKGVDWCRYKWRTTHDKSWMSPSDARNCVELLDNSQSIIEKTLKKNAKKARKIHTELDSKIHESIDKKTKKISRVHDNHPVKGVIDFEDTKKKISHAKKSGRIFEEPVEILKSDKKNKTKNMIRHETKTAKKKAVNEYHGFTSTETHDTDKKKRHSDKRTRVKKM